MSRVAKLRTIWCKLVFSWHKLLDTLEMRLEHGKYHNHARSMLEFQYHALIISTSICGPTVHIVGNINTIWMFVCKFIYFILLVLLEKSKSVTCQRFFFQFPRKKTTQEQKQQQLFYGPHQSPKSLPFHSFPLFIYHLFGCGHHFTHYSMRIQNSSQGANPRDCPHCHSMYRYTSTCAMFNGVVRFASILLFIIYDNTKVQLVHNFYEALEHVAYGMFFGILYVVIASW